MFRTASNLFLNKLIFDFICWQTLALCYLPCWYDGGARTHRSTTHVITLMPGQLSPGHIPWSPHSSLWSPHSRCWPDQIRTKCCDRVSSVEWPGARHAVQGEHHRRRSWGVPHDAQTNQNIQTLFLWLIVYYPLINSSSYIVERKGVKCVLPSGHSSLPSPLPPPPCVPIVASNDTELRSAGQEMLCAMLAVKFRDRSQDQQHAVECYNNRGTAWGFSRMTDGIHRVFCNSWQRNNAGSSFIIYT